MAEQCLVSQIPNPVSFKGRGNGFFLQANSPSAPQNSQGCAVTAALIALRRRLAGLRRMRMYRTKGAHNRHQVREYRTLLRKFPAHDDLHELEAQLRLLEANLASKRRESWTVWCREPWSAHPGKLYRYIKGARCFLTLNCIMEIVVPLLRCRTGSLPSFPTGTTFGATAQSAPYFPQGLCLPLPGQRSGQSCSA